MLLGLASFGLECLGPEETEDGDNPILTANIFSRWSYSYMTPLTMKGAIRYITEDDLPPLVPGDTSTTLASILQECITRQFVTRSNIPSQLLIRS